MQKFYLLALGLLFSFLPAVQAQDEEQQNFFDRELKREIIRTSRLFGKVVDAVTKKGIEAASIQILVPVEDSIPGTYRDSLIAGGLTKPNGDFSFVNITVPDSFIVKITSIGFGDHTEYYSLNRPAGSADPNFTRDLGNIALGTSEGEDLQAVTIVGSRPQLTMGIDRKIFNVDKSITSTGGTGIDVMRNIPSITVDVEGNIQLRNSSPQIFVDGRPTILTLDQIPADDIERVELITNPSAKFDAASSGGIINIILKKNRRLGINGLVSVGYGTPKVRTGNIGLNLRQGKFNFFATGNLNQSGGVAKGETFRQNRNNGVLQDYFNQYSSNDRLRRFTSVRFGVDYFVDNRNTISITQNITRGKFENIETQRQEYLNSGKQLLRTGSRISESFSQFRRNNTQLSYKHSFPKTGQELTADVTYNKGSRDNNSTILNEYFNLDGTLYEDPNRVNNYGESNGDQVTVQVDYVNPISEISRIEMGLRSFISNDESIFDAFSMNNGLPSKLPLSNNYRYREQVNAGYVTYTNMLAGIGYQIGLRAEHSDFEGELVDSAQKFGYEYPNSIKNLWDALFPSLYLSKKVGDNHEFQLNYSRRIRRPRFWQLNPFIDINDPVNIQQGNPAIRPEFTNSFEFNYQNTYNSGSFLGVLYFRNNVGDITRYSDTITAAQYQQLNNAAIDPNAILNTFINASFTNRMGAEFTLQQKLGENLEIIPTINLQYRKVKATVNNLNLSNEGFNWEGKLMINYSIPSQTALFKDLNFQLRGEYESREVIAQGRMKEQFNVDAAFRKEFLKDKKGTLTFAVNDVFNSNRWGQIYDTERFYQDSYRRWNVRNFRVTFSYRFGSRDMNLFGRDGDRGGRGGDDD